MTSHDDTNIAPIQMIKSILRGFEQEFKTSDQKILAKKIMTKNSSEKLFLQQYLIKHDDSSLSKLSEKIQQSINYHTVKKTKHDKDKIEFLKAVKKQADAILIPENRKKINAQIEAIIAKADSQKEKSKSTSKSTKGNTDADKTHSSSTTTSSVISSLKRRARSAPEPVKPTHDEIDKLRTKTFQASDNKKAASSQTVWSPLSKGTSSDSSPPPGTMFTSSVNYFYHPEDKISNNEKKFNEIKYLVAKEGLLFVGQPSNDPKVEKFINGIIEIISAQYKGASQKAEAFTKLMDTIMKDSNKFYNSLNLEDRVFIDAMKNSQEGDSFSKQLLSHIQRLTPDEQLKLSELKETVDKMQPKYHYLKL